MITNEAGQIALKWSIERRNPPPDTAQKTGYIFIPKSNIFLAWVKPTDVERLLSAKAKTCNCSNGIYKTAFAYASRLDVALWETGDRHHINPNYTETE